MTTGYPSASASRAPTRQDSTVNPAPSIRQQAVHGHDDVADGAHAPELVGLDALAGHFLQLDDEVDRVDAVEVEVAIQVGLGRDARRVDFELVGEQLAQLRQDLGVGHPEVTAPCARMNSASVRTERKCSRTRWSACSSLSLYFLCSATPSSRASIESRPRPSSANSGVSSPMSSGFRSSRCSESTTRTFSSRRSSFIAFQF